MNLWITSRGQKVFQILRGRSNCFLVISRNKALIIDTGRKNKRVKVYQQIISFLQKGYTPVALILTHAHFDHAENAAFLKNKFRIPVIIHKNETGYLKEGINPPVRGSFFLTRLLVTLWETKFKSLFRYEPAEYDIAVEERYELNDLGFDGYILHTPGHSSGSVSIIIDDEIAIVGDAMFGILKCLIYPPFAWNADLMVKSWGKLLDTNCKVFLPAHGTSNSRECIEKQYRRYRKTMK